MHNQNLNQGRGPFKYESDPTIAFSAEIDKI